MRKSLIITSAAAAFGLAVLGGGIAYTKAASPESGASSLVDKIAEHFNLNKDEVQKVIDEHHQEMNAQRIEKAETRLDQLVKDGKLTQNQADKIKAKMAEMKTFIESLKDKTPEERKIAMDSKMTELKQWAKDNGIAEEYLQRGPDGKHGMKGRGMHRGGQH